MTKRDLDMKRLAVPISARHFEERLRKSVRPFWSWAILTAEDAGSLEDKTDAYSPCEDKWRSLCERTFHSPTFSHCSLNPQVGFSNLDKQFFRKKWYGRRICQLCHNQSYVSSYVVRHWLVWFPKLKSFQAHSSDPLNMIQPRLSVLCEWPIPLDAG